MSKPEEISYRYAQLGAPGRDNKLCDTNDFTHFGYLRILHNLVEDPPSIRTLNTTYEYMFNN
jgi:hypothetical protein